MPREGAFERAHHAGIPDAIPIASCAVAANRAWKVSGTRSAASTRIASGRRAFNARISALALDRTLERKTGDLAQRVHPGVGAVRRRRRSPRADRAVPAPLRAGPGSTCPPPAAASRRSPRAVVGEGDLVSAHGVTRRTRGTMATRLREYESRVTESYRIPWCPCAVDPTARQIRPSTRASHRQSCAHSGQASGS